MKQAPSWAGGIDPKGRGDGLDSVSPAEFLEAHLLLSQLWETWTIAIYSHTAHGETLGNRGKVAVRQALEGPGVCHGELSLRTK